MLKMRGSEMCLLVLLGFGLLSTLVSSPSHAATRGVFTWIGDGIMPNQWDYFDGSGYANWKLQEYVQVNGPYGPVWSPNGPAQFGPAALPGQTDDRQDNVVIPVGSNITVDSDTRSTSLKGAGTGLWSFDPLSSHTVESTIALLDSGYLRPDSQGWKLGPGIARTNSMVFVQQQGGQSYIPDSMNLALRNSAIYEINSPTASCTIEDTLLLGTYGQGEDDQVCEFRQIAGLVDIGEIWYYGNSWSDSSSKGAKYIVHDGTLNVHGAVKITDQGPEDAAFEIFGSGAQIAVQSIYVAPGAELNVKFVFDENGVSPIEVSGDARIAGTIEVDFDGNSFEEDSLMDLFNVAGNLTWGKVTLKISNAPGDRWGTLEIDPDNGSVQVEIIPEPMSSALMIAAMGLGLKSARRRT